MLPDTIRCSDGDSDIIYTALAYPGCSVYVKLGESLEKGALALSAITTSLYGLEETQLTCVDACMNQVQTQARQLFFRDRREVGVVDIVIFLPISLVRKSGPADADH